MKIPEPSPNLLLPGHVLLVEDDPALSLVLVRTLGHHLPTIRVSSAESVEQAWGVLEEGPVDLLITDLHLPGVDGIALIRRIRERGWQQPVIVISGYGLNAVTEACDMLHIFAVLAKPFQMTSLLTYIVAALNETSAGSDERRAI